MWKIWTTYFLTLLFVLQSQVAFSQSFTIAAASDLKFALEELVQIYQKRSGEKIRLVFGSSGQFYSQLLQGAPFHIFMSADESFVFQLHQSGLTRDKGRLYAYGRIGLMVPKYGAIKADPELQDLKAAIKDGRLKKLAIASPEHAPYGMRAKEALIHTNLWSSLQLQNQLVMGENISQATQFTMSGSAQAGIVAYSLALAPAIAEKTDFALLPSTWHQPLAQRMVLLKKAPPSAQQFFDYMASPFATSIMQKYGFQTPVQP